MEDDLFNLTEINLGKEIAKSFVLTAAATAGAWGCGIAILYAFGKTAQVLENRRTKKKHSK